MKYVIIGFKNAVTAVNNAAGNQISKEEELKIFSQNSKKEVEELKIMTEKIKAPDDLIHV